MDTLKKLNINKYFIPYYKYFIGYLYNNSKVKPLHVMLPKTRAYVRSYDGQTKWMYFLIGDDDLLEKYNTIWSKVRADTKKLAWILLSRKMRIIFRKYFQKRVNTWQKK